MLIQCQTHIMYVHILIYTFKKFYTLINDNDTCINASPHNIQIYYSLSHIEHSRTIKSPTNVTHVYKAPSYMTQQRTCAPVLGVEAVDFAEDAARVCAGVGAGVVVVAVAVEVAVAAAAEASAEGAGVGVVTAACTSNVVFEAVEMP